MTNPTSNFGWQMPTSTDLVTDLPADFEVFGQAVDTSLADLKGGTTGQVLSKASATDMDFTWVAQDDSNAIQNALLTTTGDTIYASGASTPARLGIGSTGDILTVAGGVPTWAAPAGGGGMTLIATNSWSSGTSTSFSSIPSTYKHLKILFIGISNSATGQITCLFNSNSASVYSWGALRYQGGSATMNSTNLDNNLNMFGGSVVPISSNGTFSGYFDIFNYSDTNRNKSGTSVGSGTDSTSSTLRTWGSTNFTYLSTTTISSIQISINNAMAGNGHVQLWGVS